MTYHSLAIYYDNQLAENEQKRVPRDNRFANLRNSIEREKWRTTMVLPMRHSWRRAARPPSNFSLTHPPLPNYGGPPLARAASMPLFLHARHMPLECFVFPVAHLKEVLTVATTCSSPSPIRKPDCSTHVVLKPR